jgi:arsenate reductase-like glutaredoxin family protein
MDESTEAKDIEAKYKDKAKVMGNQLDAEVARFKSEAASFKENAMKNGQAWAQQKGSELQQREERLNYAQQAMLQQLQQESGVEMDTLVKNYRKVIKDYGKENLTPENGLIYWGMAGQSLVKDIRDALQKHGINASVFRGYETGRQSQEHDYIIILK